MSIPVIHIRPFEKTASQADFAALNRHNNCIRLERLPDDPPVPLDETVQNLRSIPPFADFKTVGNMGC